MKVQTQRQSPTQDEPEEYTPPPDIQDPSNYQQIFQPKKRLCKYLTLSMMCSLHQIEHEAAMNVRKHWLCIVKLPSDLFRE